jgi:hypothetical protein
MLETLPETVNVVAPCAMDCRPEKDYLFVPRLNQCACVIDIHFRVGEVLKQPIFLLNDALIVGKSLNIAMMKRDYSAVKEPSTGVRPAAHHIEFVGREGHDV